MTYAESIAFLYDLRLFGMKLGLENTRRLAALAGHPQERLRFIHIAGTNGKGSVAATLESIYRASGYRVGLFTSPHLISFRERIQVDRTLISEDTVVRSVADLRALMEADGGLPRSAPRTPRSDRPSPTFFEFVTVMALRHFEDQRCDLVIWETGMGGRLDATNIVNPLACVITNIQADHQRWLGEDLRSIAREKAGIIKPRIPVVTAADNAEALSVIRETSHAQASPLTVVGPADAFAPPLGNVDLPFAGEFQRINAATAVATTHALQKTLPVSLKAIHKGLANVNWPGRLQLLALSDGRRILLDGAHNVAAALALRAALGNALPSPPGSLIIGILRDKDWGRVCEILAPLASRIVCPRLKTDRAADPNALAAACRRVNACAEVTTAESTEAALEQAPTGSATLVVGSLYLVGEALKALEAMNPTLRDEVGLNDWTPDSGFHPKPFP